MPSNTLTDELRKIIRDTKCVASAMSVSVSDGDTTSAVLELTRARLILTSSGGTLRGFSLDLTSPLLDTVGKLYQHLHRYPDLAAAADEEMNEMHLSADLEEFGPTDIVRQGMKLRHHTFSDWELDQVLQRAVSRHNPSLSITAIPPAEKQLVLVLAQVEVLRIRAQDASKRKGTDTDVSTLLSIASSLESQYEGDIARLSRVLQPAKEAPTGSIQGGDFVQGKMFRRAPRNGFVNPMGAAAGPPPVPLLEPDERDPEDTMVLVRWVKSPDQHFHSYELWMDTQEDVQRMRESILLSGLPSSGSENAGGAVRVSSSKLMFRAFGASSNKQTVSFATFIESYGQLITKFNVSELEPETDYFFRLYTQNLNFESTGSAVVKVRTLALRAKFSKTLNAYPVTLAVGATATVVFDSTYGTFSPTTHTLTLGGKAVTAVLSSGVTYTFTVPSFFNKGLKDLVVVSPNGLKDVYTAAVLVT